MDLPWIGKQLIRYSTHFIIGCALLCVPSVESKADYTGLAVVLESAGQITAAGPRDVYRVFAEFTNPNDRVDSWYGTTDSPISIQNVLADGTTLGSGFTNFGGAGGILPPEIPGTIRDWDTWATIGVVYLDEPGVDYLAVSPFPFPPFIAGNSLTTESHRVYLWEPTAVQGQAGFRVAGNDTAMRVLLMQLTVSVGQHVRGTINIDGHISGSSAGQSFTASNQTFASIPVPSVIPLLGLALVTCRTRCRQAPS